MPRIIGPLKNKSNFDLKKTLVAALLGQFMISGVVYGVNSTIVNITGHSSHTLGGTGDALTATSIASIVNTADNGGGTLTIPSGTYSITGGPIVQCAFPALLGNYSINVSSGGDLTRTDTGPVIDMTKATKIGIINITNTGKLTAKAGSNSIDFTGSAASLNFQNNAAANTISGDIVGSANPNDTFNIAGGRITGNINGGTGIATLTITNNPIITGNIQLPLKANVLNIGTTGAFGVPANFSTGGDITNAQTINVQNTTDTNNFTINNAITGVKTFATLSGTKTIIANNGSIYGINNSSSLINSGTVTINSGGTLSIPIVFSTTNAATLNIAGGTITSPITSDNGGGTQVATINITNTPTVLNNINLSARANVLNIGTAGVSGVSANFSTNGNITNAQRINVNKTTGTDAFTINDEIIGVQTFTTLASTNTTVAMGGVISSIDPTAAIINSGNLTLNAGGNINVPVNFGSTSGARLNLSGGTISKPITGYAAGDSNTVNINSDYITSNIIDKVGTINVASSTDPLSHIVIPTTFTVSNPITNIAAGFTLGTNTTTVVGGNNVTVTRSGNTAVLTNSGVLTLSKGSNTSIPITFGSASGAILNISGGTINQPITGHAGSDANVINVTNDFTVSNTISGVGAVNVSGTLANSTIFTVNKSITGVATGITLGANTATIIGPSTIGGANVNIARSAGSTGVLTNSGALTLKAGSTIDIPVSFGAVSGTILNLNGGTINQPITGYNVGDTNTININSDFITGNTIDKISNINVYGTLAAPPTSFTINKTIIHVATGIKTGSNTTTVINSNGDLSGGGTITNAGSFSTNGGAIGNTAAMGDFINNGTFTVNSGPVNVGAFTNNSTAASTTLNIISGNMTVAGIIKNTFGGIKINGGDLSSATGITSDLTNASGQTITVSGAGTVGSSCALGNVTNKGIITATSSGDIQAATLTNFGNVNASSNIYLTGNIDNQQNGTITVGTGKIFGKPTATTAGIVNLTNSGTLINSGTLNATTIAQSGIMITNGIINSPITFPANSNSNLIIKGGTINGSITADHTTGINNAIEINVGVGNSFSLSPIVPPTPGIEYVGAVKIDSGTFNINNNITHVDNNFTAAVGTITIVGVGGELAGNGTINNAGTITINGDYNSTINMDKFINNNAASVLQIQDGKLIVNRMINDYGSIIISGVDALYNGDLSSSSSNNKSPLINAAGCTITVSGTGTIGANTALGTVTNNGIITAGGGDVAVGDFVNNNINAAFNITKGIIKTGNISNILGNTLGSITIGGDALSHGDLSSADAPGSSTLTNAANQTITISGAGTIGANGALGTVTNYGTFNATGGDIDIGDFINNNANAVLNITSGIVKTGNINNTLGAILGGITIGDAASPSVLHGDLSSSGAAGSSTLTNAANQTITVSGTGTIGAHGALGTVTNYGTFNATGGDIDIGNFINNNAKAVLKITSGIVKTGNINNNLGAILGGITIGDAGSQSLLQGDLSSAGAAGSSTLTNAANQTITVSGTGTIGAHGALGTVTNYGTFNANGGNIAVGNFINNNANAALNITSGTANIGALTNTLGTVNISHATANTGALTNTSGTVNISNSIVKTGNIRNTLGSIQISSGSDLSSVGAAGSSTLTNAANQTITVSGSMGAHGALGAITNNGRFNINGPVKILGAFNNAAGAITNFLANVDVGVNNVFTNNGTVNMLQTSHITNGNYTLSATGTHIVNIGINSNPGQLILDNGFVTLKSNSTIDIRIVGDPLIADQQKFTLISGNTPATLEPNVTLLGATDLISYTVGQSINNYDIEITANKKSIIDAIGADLTNKDILVIAQTLDNLWKTGVVGDLKTALAKLEGLASKEEVINAISQLLPEANIIPETGFIGTSIVFGTIAERADLIARSGINNIQTGFSAGSMQANNSLWIKGLGGSVCQQQRVSSAGYNANTVGFAFGVDDQILEDTWLGVGLSSVGTHVKSKDAPSRKTNIMSMQGTLYGSYSPEDYYIDSFVAIASNNYKLSRNIRYNGLNQTASANYTAIQPSAKAAAGYIYNFDYGFRVIPNLSLQYSTLKQNVYNETGAGGLSLQQVASTALTQLEGGVGIKFALLHNKNNDQTNYYNPELHFMVLHDFNSAPQATTAQFLGGGGSFTVQGAVPDKTTYNVGASITFVHKNRLNFTANYDLRKKNKYIGHAGSLAVRYEI